MSPDEAVFRAHVAAPAFQDGLDRGRWGLLEPNGPWIWPHVILWVPADLALLPAGRLYLRFTLDRYPQQAPTACPWDVEKNMIMPRALWPKGPGNVTEVFGSNFSQIGLYAPCDRVAMVNHAQWKTTFPDLWWQPHFTIVVYLDFVHQVLNRQKYACP